VCPRAENASRKQETCVGLEGNFIFAGESLPVAVGYALKTRDNDTNVAHLRSCGALSSGIPVAWVDNFEKLIDHHPVGRIFQVENKTFTQVADYEGVPTGEWVSEDARVGMTAIKDVTPEYAMTVGVQIFSFKPGTSKEAVEEFKATQKLEISDNFKSAQNPHAKWSRGNPQHILESSTTYLGLLDDFIINPIQNPCLLFVLTLIFIC
jgi:hypothetical protein